DFSVEMELGIPFDLGLEMQRLQQPRAGQQPVATAKIVKLIMIETLEKSTVWEREFAIIPPNQVQIRFNHWRI
ncbi:MAG: hypothetical protein ACRD1J_02920, partial [Terriglobia bacterium]